MLKKNFLARLKMLFFEKGISSRKSHHLIEELQDHLILQEVELVKYGYDTEEAERLAVESIGTPEVIAEKARAELNQSRLLLRWAWLPCGAGFFIASFLVMIAILFLGSYLSGSIRYYDNSASLPNIPILLVAMFLINWLPLLIGIGALVLLIRFSSIGWRSIFIGALALGFAISGVAVRFEITPIFNTDKSCFLCVYMTNFFQWLFNLERVYQPPIIPALFKFFAPLCVCLFARYLEPRLAAKTS